MLGMLQVKGGRGALMARSAPDSLLPPGRRRSGSLLGISLRQDLARPLRAIPFLHWAGAGLSGGPGLLLSAAGAFPTCCRSMGSEA